MATFKRLKQTGGEEVDVNIDTVVHMQWYTDHTVIHFVTGSLNVREMPDQILLARPSRQA